MAEVVLFHHVQGLTAGVREFAERLRAGGNAVHTPDLFDGELPPTLDDGIALVQRIGEPELETRADAAVAAFPGADVYGGFSFGAATAQRIAQTRDGVRGALLYESFVALSAPWSFGPWPDGLSAQVHGMDNDPFFALEGDLDGARELVELVGPDRAELFVYRGDHHLFTDSSLPAYDAAATDVVIARSVAFLARLG